MTIVMTDFKVFTLAVSAVPKHTAIVWDYGNRLYGCIVYGRICPLMGESYIPILSPASVSCGYSYKHKKLSYCWETVRRESVPRIAEMDVKMTT